MLAFVVRLAPNDFNIVERLIYSWARGKGKLSRSATKDGDYERAYNLATKAHLLSDALLKK